MSVLFFFVIGACLGSFVPCFAERRQQGLSQAGRSRCPHCGHVIAPLALLPIIGYFHCHGYCQYCHAPIPRALPLIEALSGCTAALLWLAVGEWPRALLLLAALAVLLLLALDDWQTQTIRDGDLLIYSLLLGLDSLLFGAHFWQAQLLGAVLVALPLWLLTRLRPDALGSGDILFMAISGFALGPVAICYAFLIGTLCALAYSLFLLRRGQAHRRTAIPLIPFLAIGVTTLLLSPAFALSIS